MNFDNAKTIEIDVKGVRKITFGNYKMYDQAPEGYTMVKYLESSKTQCIDTEYKLTSDVMEQECVYAEMSDKFYATSLF